MFTRPRLISVLLVVCGCLLAPVFLCACGISFKSVEPNFIRRDELREGLPKDKLLVTDETAVTPAANACPRFPCRIAVYVKPLDHQFDWDAEDCVGVETWAIATLKKEGFASEVFQLRDNPVGKNGLTELRETAARQGADLLFVVRGASSTDSYSNLGAILNLTIVGAFIVPGDHHDVLFTMDGSLIDVNDGHVYTTIHTEELRRTIRPLLFNDETVALDRAKKKALAAFGDEVLKRFRTMAAAQPPDREVTP